MCFSAQASFISSALLFVFSFFTIKAVKQKSWYALAAVPLLFSIQQFTEGLFWLNQNKILAYLFLIFAQLVWPIWLPFSVWLVEERKRNKNIIGFLIILGIAWSCVLAWSLITYGSVVEIKEHHIYYQISVPVFSETLFSIVLYCIPTLGAFFVSTRKYMYIFGVIGIISSIFTLLIWTNYFLSVWCFWAALLSITTLIIIKRNQISLASKI